MNEQQEILDWLMAQGCTLSRRKTAKGSLTNLYVCTYRGRMVTEGNTLDNIEEMIMTLNQDKV